jgi:CNT family concentrative nucleoside transporter
VPLAVVIRSSNEWVVPVVVATIGNVLGACTTYWLARAAVTVAPSGGAKVRRAGALLGTKTVLNEFVAYLELANLPPEALSPRSRLLMTYARCGFANFGSLGILIGGMGVMVPERRAEIVALGMKSIVAGTLATCMAAAVAGLFI